MAHFEVDLHAHTTASDGTHSPTQLVERAAERGLRVVAVTDHDNIAGVAEAQAAGARLGVEVVAGVEFSTKYEPEKQFLGIHLLGYFIDPTAPDLIEMVDKVQQGRIEQKTRQIEKLQTFGFDIPVDLVFNQVSGVPGRPHIAKVLLERNPDRFSSIQQVFDEYLGTGAKAHVKRQFALTVGQAIQLVKAAGGLPVFAHPGAYEADLDPLTAVRNAKAAGVEGVEVYYPYDKGHRPNQAKSKWIGRIEALAQELDLLKTGGTDFHGREHDAIDLGDMGLTLEQFAALKKGWHRLRKITPA